MAATIWGKSDMALSVTYTNFAGGIAYENRGGTESYYVSDTLGSTAALVNRAGVATDTWTYWPYGEIRIRAGSTSTPFTFCGVIGYFQDLTNNFMYVRARHLRISLARWQTVDGFWPLQPAFAYVGNFPLIATDPSGLIGPVLGGLLGGAIGCGLGSLLSSIGQAFTGGQDPAGGCKVGVACASGGLAGMGAGITAGTLGAAVLLGCLGGALASAVDSIGDKLCDCKYNPCQCAWNNADTCNAIADAIAGCGAGLVSGAESGLPIGGKWFPGTPKGGLTGGDIWHGGVVGGLIGFIANRLGVDCATAFPG